MMCAAKEQFRKLLAEQSCGEILAAFAARDKKSSFRTSLSGGES